MPVSCRHALDVKKCIERNASSTKEATDCSDGASLSRRKIRSTELRRLIARWERETHTHTYTRRSLFLSYFLWLSFSRCTRARARDSFFFVFFLSSGTLERETLPFNRRGVRNGITPLFTFKRLFMRAHRSREIWQCNRSPPGCCHSICCHFIHCSLKLDA